MTTYFLNNITNRPQVIQKPPQNIHTITAWKKCVNLNGTNNKICAVDLEDGNEGFVAISDKVDENKLENNIRIKYCDPTKEICKVDLPNHIF